MIPYKIYSEIDLGFIRMQTWGLMVALGIFASFLVSYRLAKKRGLQADKLIDLSIWVVIFALVFARLFHVFFYQWSYYSQNLIEIFKIWEGGLASFGGFLGGAIAAVIFFKKHQLTFWQYADLIVFGLPLGLFIGRIGCFLNHLHPGTKSNFFLAVNFPDGPRHDLGLYLSLNGLILFLTFLILERKRRFRGFYLVFFFLWYGMTRFTLDFLRAWDLENADVRYFYLTPAQYGSLILVILGIYFLIILPKTKNAT